MSAAAIAFTIYFLIGLLLIVVALAAPGRERRVKGLEAGGTGDVVDAWLLIFIAVLWPIWVLITLSKKKPDGSSQQKDLNR